MQRSRKNPASHVYAHALPQELALKEHTYGSINVDRQPVKLRTQNGQTFSNSGANGVIEVYVPRDLIYDFSRATLEFDVAITPTGGTARLVQGAWNIFKNFFIKIPGIMEQTLNCNKCWSVLREALSENGVQPIVGPQEGVDTAAARDANALVTTRYQIPFWCGMLRRQPFPAPIAPQLLLQWHLAPSTEVIEGGAGLTAAVITVSNFIINCEALERPPSPVYQEQSSVVPDYYFFIEQAMKSMGGIDLAFRNFEVYESPPQTTQRFTINIPSRRSNVDYIMCYFQQSGFSSSFFNNDKYITWNKGDGAAVTCTSYSMRRGAKIFPKEPFDATGKALEPWKQFLLWHGCWKEGGVWKDPGVITNAQFNTNRFLIILPLNPHMRDKMISNVSTSDDTLDILIDFVLSGVPAGPGIVVTTFVQHFDQVRLLPGGIMEEAK